MGAPKGSQNALGNPGGGRKSAYQENMDAKFLQDIWNGEIKEEELVEIVNKKKYGAKHIFAIMVLTRDPKMMGKLVDKLYANKQKIEMTDPIDEEARDQLNKLNQLINNAKATATTPEYGDSESEPPSC